MPEDGNDGRWPDGTRVRTRYPSPGITADTPREAWPWMNARVELQGAPDEWVLTIEDRSVAELENGDLAPEGTPDDDLWHPQAFRDASEIRHPLPQREAEIEAGA